MEQVLDIISWICIGFGAFFAVTGGVGLFRLPDFYSRVHASGMDDTLGVLLILLGLLIQNGLDLNGAKLIFIFFFLLFTGPAATHALVKAARHGGLKPLLGEGASSEEEREDEKSK